MRVPYYICIGCALRDIFDAVDDDDISWLRLKYESLSPPEQTALDSMLTEVPTFWCKSHYIQGTK